MIEQTYDHKWHLDRRVPLALIVTIMIQTFGAIWWAASVSSRIDVAENKIQSIEKMYQLTTGQVASNKDLSSRIDERLNAVQRSLDQIERKLDRAAR